jgi:hypothetical protein
MEWRERIDSSGYTTVTIESSIQSCKHLIHDKILAEQILHDN